MFLGIDLGTSELKALLVGQDGGVIASAQRPLRVSRPQPRWAEQDPAMWWQATQEAIESLQRSHRSALNAVRAIGLSGQMHGATLLDRTDRVLRPAILWNDTRSDSECLQLADLVPTSQAITGNLVMPGFTAPKLLWVAKRQPEIFSCISSVLLPKDYLRLCLTGEKISDMADASGSLWLGVAARKWSGEMLAATRLTEAHMPMLVESNAPGDHLREELARTDGACSTRSWLPEVQATTQRAPLEWARLQMGTASFRWGTSGVVFVSGDRFRPNAQSGVHAFCHALPARWHQMSVMLSAASCLRATRLCGAESEASLLQETAAAGSEVWRKAPLFLPYLSGERTPHNDPYAQGIFFGMTHETDRASLGYAVMEGVAFGLADGLAALVASGTAPACLSLVGGGSRSDYWAQLIANTLNMPIITHASGRSAQ